MFHSYSCVCNSTFLINCALQVLKALTPLFVRWKATPAKMILYRTLAILAYTMVVSATMATMTVGLAGMNNNGA